MQSISASLLAPASQRREQTNQETGQAGQAGSGACAGNGCGAAGRAPIRAAGPRSRGGRPARPSPASENGVRSSLVHPMFHTKFDWL